MRWIAWLSAAAAAVSAASLPSSQVAFQAPIQEPMDIVDMMADEAHRNNIPLNAALERVAPTQNFRGSWTWTPCDFADAAISVYSIETIPDPPIKGQNLTVRGVGDVHTEITEGATFEAQVRLGPLRVFSQKFDLCETLRENNVTVQCPIAPGHYDVSHTVYLPQQIPPAKFGIHVTGLTQDGRLMTCLDFTVSFMRFIERWRAKLGWT
ncbi:hypothetical protein MCAP1_000189 [Malassezia caprae]|uniref:Phosphatidylglycerol/phosphatidylinositol transfer protein n=1 Tax=Malassezia caprae TaxID=1381934 RepID=A0AAF0IUZ4_9BASI|nr:hypothetical protein MCAP1_000189 [Malassezia caprae]